MGGTDLNLKKSWHPQLMVNQRRVYDAERAALAERKLTEARVEEIRRERQIEETQKQLEAAGGPKRVDRVDWMYAGPTDGSGGGDSFSNEAFLLGKRRVDSILKGDNVKKIEANSGAGGTEATPVGLIVNARDTAAKIREDPLVAIKRQEQAAYEEMMNNPAKRRQLMIELGIFGETKARQSKDGRDRKEERRHRHHHRRRRDDEDDEHRQSRRRRRYSDASDRSRSPRRRSSEGHRRDYRRNDRSRERRQSDSREDDRRRRDTDRRQDDSIEQRDTRMKRGRSNRSPSSRHDSRSAPPRQYERQQDNRRHDESSGPSQQDLEERARRLAAMQNAATALDDVREARLKAMEQEEKAELEADDAARSRAAKYGGGDRQFRNGLHQSIGNESLADRIGRGRAGFQKDDD